jgi:thiol-disulfide isomerase/thioredoxin
VAASDTTVRGSELLEIVQGFERHATNNPHVSYAILPALSIERSTYYSEAEAITRRGLDQAEAYVHVRRTSETEKEHARRKNWLYSRIHDALGWVLIHQDRLKEAAAELETAINLNKGNQIAWYHRGIVAERLGELDSAESFYSQSLSISWPGENPAEISLARLYEVRNADKEGYATYRRNLSTQHTSLRREDVLAARLATPFRPPAFAMMTIAADTVSLDQNLGKIQVINFWGTWCAPCVQELPELQALHEKYTGDGGVSIITINNDGDADMVKDWLADRSYSFTTLFDHGYVKERAAIRSFPTTWFVDQTGLVTYVQAGSTLRLLEEFSWRIESLR